MAKAYDPIMCMMVDEPTKAHDELSLAQKKQGIKATTTAAKDPLNKGSVMYRVEWN